ncbi:MAG TPA: DedA family protein [Anaeromyxobacteraceae bacterium]|nr:DedA family protein [Anaeromyxobacteraceae bacterium]
MLERLVEHLQNQSLGLGYAFTFGVLILCGFGFPLPEDIILVTGGVLAWIASPLDQPSVAGMFQDLGLQVMVLVGLSGILGGDSIIYWAGRRFGRRVAEVWPFRRLITPGKLERVERLLRRRGNVVVMIARFLPGLRAPTYFTVGHSRLPFWEFLLFDGMAALVSAPLWVFLGFWFGDDIERAAREASRFGHYILAAALTVAVVLGFRSLRRRKASPGGGGNPSPAVGDDPGKPPIVR